MEKKEKGVWSYFTKEELHGIYYDYKLKIDGDLFQSADPYAKACGANGQRSMFFSAWRILSGVLCYIVRGCFAQAWSVGEILRVYAEIEKAGEV